MRRGVDRRRGAWQLERLRGTDDSSLFEVRTLDGQGLLVSTATLTLLHSEAPPVD